MYLNASTNDVEVKTQFHVYAINRKNYYVVHSNHKDGVYVFEESKLKYLLESFSIKSREPIVLNNIKFQDRIYKKNTTDGETYDVNHGDHMTFFLLCPRNLTTVVKAHLTHYKDNVNDYTFARSIKMCNFTFPESLDNFNNIHCEHDDGIPIRKDTIESQFGFQARIEIVKNLCVQMLKHDHSTPIRGGRRPPQGYKNVHFFVEELSSFLFDTFFSKLFPHWEFIMIYDEDGQMSNDHIVILASDDECNRSVFHIDPHRCFKACHAHNNPIMATKRERTCLKKWHACIKSIQEYRKNNIY